MVHSKLDRFVEFVIKFIDSKTCAEHESLHCLISTLGREYFAENRAQSEMTKLDEKQLRG